MSEGTDAYADSVKDKDRIGREYSASDTEAALYTFRIFGENVGLKVRRVKGSYRLVAGKSIWGNSITWGNGTNVWGDKSPSDWVTVFEETDPQ